MKHIVIDARLYGPKHTGIGRYTKNLLIALAQQPLFKKYRYTLIIYKELESEVKKDLGDNFDYITTTIRHYSIAEQLILPLIIYKLKPDLVHFTHFNKPLLYFGKSIVTIHDLIKHFFKGRLNTTKNAATYWIKHFFYMILTDITIKTNTVIVPSDFWRDYIIKNFHISPSKITTTHEAVDPGFMDKIDALNKKTPICPPQNYIIYTGNLYPHKNVEIIIESLKNIPDVSLKIICARNYFTQRIENMSKKLRVYKQIEFLGYIPDTEFKKIYAQAIALVHPSLMEGFSLTGLEAMALGCPVISSNSSCLPEIYQDSVLYFDPNDSQDLTHQIKKLQNSNDLRQELIEQGFKQIKKYSWDNTAKQTFSIYQQTLKIEK